MTEAEALARYPGAVAFKFGDGPELNAQILTLVRSGKKTITCDAVANFARRGEPHPVPGRVDVALDWDGRPTLALRTVAVDLIRFDEMSETLIAGQGEFRDLAHWRKGYESYLTRAGLFAADMMMLVERFEVVEVLG
tara:strand:- start:181 stop:591 length:411 start_codon:yes stop_codon:yes gene_type:complete